MGKTEEYTVQEPQVEAGDVEEVVAAVEGGVPVNASGHRDQLRRQYTLLGLCGIALTVDNAWVALGSSISVSIGESKLLMSYRVGTPGLILQSQWRTTWPHFWPHRGGVLLHVYWAEFGRGKVFRQRSSVCEPVTE
jgi:hypothetical protein